MANRHNGRLSRRCVIAAPEIVCWTIALMRATIDFHKIAVKGRSAYYRLPTALRE